MLQSMTGYGKAEENFAGKRIAIEVKSLNSKQGDIFTRIPAYYKEKELEIRKISTSYLQRGKIEVSIFVENFSAESNYSINKELAMKYFQELKPLADAIGNTDFKEYLPVLVKMPDVLVNQNKALDPQEWAAVHEGLKKCLEKVVEYRKSEGEELQKDFVKRVRNIEGSLEKVTEFEENRIEKMKDKLRKEIKENLDDNLYDKNRFEQELIYYLEKFDITEEKVRLKNHCEYFIKTLDEKESYGKKLNFISQEIGREINTIGSKANDTDIQHLVVVMKDELEKIKEQLSNIL